MKKNVMMRIASVLLVAVMLTTCVISGTFAKYVTSDEATDSARVAKWGVVVTVTGDAFAKTYALDTVAPGVDNGLAVESSTEDKVVAPGTTGTFGGISVTGTPEVAVNINTEATVVLNGWELAGSVFYCPVIVTIGTTDICGLDYTSAADFADAIELAIEAANGNYEANTNLSGVTGLNGSYTWEWAFTDADHDATGHTHVIEQTDGRDTELGNRAANGFLNNISITVETIVTQID